MREIRSVLILVVAVAVLVLPGADSARAAASLRRQTDSCPNLTASLQSTVPLPFGDVFALEKPVVLSVTPTCANAGDTFTITGTGMYPSLVKSVLIDGSPLDSSQCTTARDTAIHVVAPDVSGFFLPVVVQTSQGDSNGTVTIEISVIDLCAGERRG